MLKLKEKVNQALYYWIYGLFLFDFVFIEWTYMSSRGVASWFHVAIRPVMVVSMLYLTALNLLSCPDKKLLLKKVFILSTISLLLLINYRQSELQYFIILCLLAVPAETKSLEKIVDVTLLILLISIPSVILLALVGILPNKVMSTPRGLRFCFGFFNPNTLSIWIVVIICLWTIKRYQKFSLLDAIGMGSLICFVFYFTKTRTAILCVFILLILILLFKLSETSSIALHCTKGIVLLFLPTCLGLSLFISSTYRETRFFLWLDHLVSNRFSLGNLALATHPISLLGQVPDWEIVLDNVYVRTLLYNGPFVFVLFWGLYYILINKCFAEKQMAWVSVCCVYAFLGISENIICHPCFNFTLLALGQLLPNHSIHSHNSATESNRSITL